MASLYRQAHPWQSLMPKAEHLGIWLPGSIRDWRCWACWGEVDREWVEVDGRLHPRYFCPKGCQPRGFIRASSVDWLRELDKLNYLRVALTYPELSGITPPTPEEVERNIQALWAPWPD